MAGPVHSERASPWRGHRRTVEMLLLLSAVAGGLDAIAFLHIGGVFVCNQTGNVLLVAMSVAGTGATNAIAGASSLLCFIAAAALGGRLLPELRPGDRLPARTALGIGTEVALIGASALLWSREHPRLQQWRPWLSQWACRRRLLGGWRSTTSRPATSQESWQLRRSHRQPGIDRIRGGGTGSCRSS